MSYSCPHGLRYECVLCDREVEESSRRPAMESKPKITYSREWLNGTCEYKDNVVDGLEAALINARDDFQNNNYLGMFDKQIAAINEVLS